MLKDRLKSRLEGESYRLTPQREAVLDVLIANAEDHLSAEEIYMHTKELHSEIGLATVYRNLELLEKLGIVHRFDYGDGQSRYEISLRDGEEHYHHHLICKQCGYIGEFHSDLLEAIEKRIEEEIGFEVTDHCLRFFGLCAQCRGKSST
ncbi:MAG TPA: transcriptional repressor [Firmicutes bacterium]|jgi:Fur family ferric uptake transcriptional regulator|nr:Fur family transcriptional regulator [Bacillota bacterium]HHT43375.1 transcriptional repressor [Bacillota bacterium]